ncbi:MAG: peptidoglycan DD-metalloendopeptidase family protein [Legionellales bacterium]
MRYFKHFFGFFILLVLVGCGSRTNYAPVAELKWQPFSKYQKNHRVVRGETLYAIAFRYDTDYRRLAALNHLRFPYSLRVGQVINVRGGAVPIQRTQRQPTYARSNYRAPSKVASRVIYAPVLSAHSSGKWLWPVSGRVVTSFYPEQGKKGINIAGVKGQRVVAASGGVVAYAGSGLAGYGNLIIIKHNNEYLTAYGNSAKNLVSEGQQVKQGQAIAEVGVLERKYWGVHFEIRKAGKPVNPLSYLHDPQHYR